MMQEKEWIQSELEVAAKIQAGMLPKSFEKYCGLPYIKLAGRSKPAKMVGGDFYDVFQIDEHQLCFLIADVSGTGLSASLFMREVRTHIKNYMMLGMPVAEVAKRVNERLNEEQEGRLFVTVFLCVLDLRDSCLRFVNAGHNRPAICHNNKKFELLDCKSDFVLGMIDEITYREQGTELCPGDRLYLYTDGVTETFNEQEEPYTEERMLQALNQHREVWKNPERLLDYMYEDLETFRHGTKQADDITMIYLSR